MKILHLALENFRGIRAVKIDFQGRDTDILGANGLGKTTIANAICWLLIDRPATEEPDFSPKTAGAQGIHHKAEMKVLADDGREIVLAKDYYEKYTRKKGAAAQELTGNITDCYVDGVKTKKKDYTVIVEQICGIALDKIKLLTVLGYFADIMTTEEKRKILFELAEEFTDDDVFAKNPELDDLKSFLEMPGAKGKYYTIDQWKTKSAEQRRGLNDSLKLLPARIDEAAKNIPAEASQYTEDGIKEILGKLEDGKARLEEELRVLQTPDGQQESIRAAIAKLKLELEEKRAVHVRQGADADFEISRAIGETDKECFSLAADCDNLEHKREYAVKARDRMNEQRKQLVEEYAAAQAEQWRESDEVCPACGQPLPPDKVQELRAAFNQRKSSQKEQINRRGQECSKEKITAKEAEIAQIDRDIDEAKKKLADAKQRLANLHTTQTTQPPFETTEEYTEIKRRIDAESAKLDVEKASSGNSAIIENVKISLDKTKENIRDWTAKLAEVQMARRAKKRVADLEQERRDASAQLERLEHGIHLCEKFISVKAAMVTESVNKHFRLVRFILFRDQINGGIKEICEPTVQNRDGKWVEYRSANYASRVNAKLDVIDTLNRHYGTNMPIILDQAESVTDVLEVGEQLIRLIVSAPDTEEFRIRYREKKGADYGRE